MPLRIYLPAGYRQSASRRYPALYLLHGGESGFREWGDRMALEELLAPFELMVFMPEAGNGMYVNGHDGQRYEDYVVWDVPSFAESHFPLIPERPGRALGGLSMGGFGSFNLGLKHPERYAALASLSGAFGMTWWNLGKREGSPYLQALGPEGSSQRHDYNSWRVLEAAKAAGHALPAIHLAVGTEDDPDVVTANRNLHLSLLTLGVSHNYAEQRGRHDWHFWSSTTPELLAFVGNAFDVLR